ncbi:MAG: RidA family protein [Gemmatimonadales bacterium]
MSEIEQRLKTLGLTLPPPQQPVANYVRAVRTGNLIYLAGHLPVQDGQIAYQGKLGRDMEVETGYEAARLVILNCLATLKHELGDLDRVRRIVKVLGMVNSAPDFTDTPAVMNGASDLLVQLFGERGRHARSAVGMSALPMGVSVEIEMIVEVE